jgi:signal transduction histidine kinase
MWDVVAGKIPKVTYNHTHDRISQKIYEGWKKGETLYVEEVKGEKLKEHLEYVSSLLPDPTIYEDSIHAFVFHIVYFTYGFFVLATPDHRPTEDEIFIRFAKVFEQTYTRFLDLQKAEIQARESQIELGLERVRARAMAMQKSNELANLVDTVFKELTKLGFVLDRFLLMLYDEVTNGSNWWISGAPAGLFVAYNNYKPYNEYVKAWKERKPKWTYLLAGHEKKEWDRYLFNQTDLALLPDPVKNGMQSVEQVYVNVSFNSFSSLTFSTLEPLPDNEFDILLRFAKVFDQTYTRFLDLQKAEAQAREAQIQLALERIRSRSLAMHHSNELKDVVEILFQQLKILGLEFDGGAAIHLFSENSKDGVIIVAAPDLASPIQIMLPYDEEAFVNNPIILDVWHAKETGENIFNRFYSFEEKNKYFDYVFKHNGLETVPQLSREFILQADSYTASFIAEKNSLLGANSWTRQTFSETDFEVLKRIAKVFEQAYIRFLDLQKAEALALRAEQDLIEIKAARKKAEDTLTELRATQAQLIQSEKMASLGELTAGIAHEIQNPLNFVNNFSEVNRELIEELEAERLKRKAERDDQLQDEIINHIKENEQKILQHGKRADSIVKGMLQHSRASAGNKEPTDINALADEYLKLSFHGMRAKDKTFNATLQTDFDTSIGRINVVPQDLGRVLLNLYNNAFYATAEKAKKSGKEYAPLVTVTTKKISVNMVGANSSPIASEGFKITVRDNGIGISQKIVDKIFQPFFTGKPTGQGTGLGLSLSYDIIKAHGGEIKVESKEDEGSEFIINLPTIGNF